MKVTIQATTQVTKRKAVLLSSALLGICTSIGVTNPARAAPRDEPSYQERRDDRDNARDDRDNAREDWNRDDKNRPRAPRGGGPRGKHRHQENGERGDFRHRDNDDDLRNDRPKLRPQIGNRGPSEERHPNHDGHTYSGVVTRVRSNTSFDANIGGNTFNVYLDAPAPFALTKGESVRINGVQKDKNDIRSATVSGLRNR